MRKKTVSVPMEEAMWKKLHFIASNESRSVSKQVWYLIRCCIEAYEHRHGPIDIAE